MRLRRRNLWLVVVSTAILASASSVAGSATAPTVETVSNGAYGFAWSPREVRTGMGVTFTNKTPGVPHGIIWTSSAKPVCAGTVPEGAGNWSSAEWSGECTFSAPGVYNYECSYHRTAMTGTVVVPGTPKATTKSASGPPTQTEATLNGEVDPEGEVTEYLFEYGTASVSERSTSAVGLGAADFSSHSVSAALTGLLPGKTYQVELVVKYGSGKTVRGGLQTFPTPAATAPTVTTLAVSGLKETGATLNGRVNPEGGAEADYFFEWGAGLEGPYTHSTEPVSLPSDGAVHMVSSQPPLSGLEAGSHYHYRLVAKNKLGSTDGEDVKFTTLSPPPPKGPPAKEPTPTPTPTPSPTPGPISPEPELAPLTPPVVAGSLKLAAPRHGATVHGSVEVSQSGAGGRLEVDLFAKSASLARRKRGARQVTVGRWVRTSVRAGNVSFSVALNAHGKSALRRHHKLALIVKITLTPNVGKAAQLTRSVVLHS